MSNTLFLLTIVINFLSVGVETDIYVPALPQMLSYFQTEELYLQQLLSINLVGLLVGGIIFGPLSDKYNNKTLLLLGQGIFIISSIGCAVVSSMSTMAVLRFIQGIGAASPITLSTAIIFSRYDEKEASIFMGFLNGAFTIGMAIAPILGNTLAIKYGWRSCFWAISGLASLAFFVSIFNFPANTHHISSSVSCKKLIQNFIEVSSNRKFQINVLIFSLMIACLTVYITNLSLVFVNGLEVPQVQFGYYQAVAILPCIIFGFLSSYLINKLGTPSTRFISLLALTMGASMMGFASLFTKSPVLISISMIFVTIGTSLGIGIFFPKHCPSFQLQQVLPQVLLLLYV